MAARRPARINAKVRAAVTNIPDPLVSRAVDEVRTAAQTALDRPTFDVIEPVDLTVGTNAIEHGLGREPSHVNVTPTVADPAFAWAWNKDNPHPDRQVLIDIVGVAQPGASILVS